MSMKKIVARTSAPSILRASTACFSAIMQQTEEQKSRPLFGSREPTHCSQAIRRAGLSSEGRSTGPWPRWLAPDRRSQAIDVITLALLAYQVCRSCRVGS